MKASAWLKSTLFAVLLLLSSVGAGAQTMQDVLTRPEQPLTFLGLDFQAVKYIGDPLTVNPEEMKGLFSKMNLLMVSEADKYNLPKAFRKNTVDYTISVTEEVNQKIDPGTLITADLSQRSRFTADKIQDLVSRYRFPDAVSGVGLVFVMEDLVKPKELTVFWVTFVDLATHKVLHTARVGGAAQGVGFRNHWAGGIHDALRTIKIQKYGEWKKKFAGS